MTQKDYQTINYGSGDQLMYDMQPDNKGLKGLRF